MFKKIIALLLVLMMVFSFAACNDQEDGEEGNTVIGEFDGGVEGPRIPWN